LQDSWARVVQPSACIQGLATYPRFYYPRLSKDSTLLNPSHLCDSHEGFSSMDKWGEAAAG
jgi:hypothetical protein